MGVVDFEVVPAAELYTLNHLSFFHSKTKISKLRKNLTNQRLFHFFTRIPTIRNETFFGS